MTVLIQVVVAMAKKTLWKDNTMPPTNFLWLKLDPWGEVIGLFEWNGVEWVKVKGKGEGGSGIKYVDKDGVEHNITDLGVDEDGHFQLVDSDGEPIVTLVDDNSLSEDYLKKEDIFDEEIDPETGQTILVVKPEIVQQIAQNLNPLWLDEE